MMFVDSAVPLDVIAAFMAFRQSVEPSSDDSTEEKLTSLAHELRAEQPSRKRILSYISIAAAAAGATEAIGKAADALSTAVRSWL
jgi:hypothetical protein